MKKFIPHTLCAFFIIAAGYLLLNYDKPAEADFEPVGGAAKHMGKMDIPNSPYFAQPDIYNMTSNENRIILPHYTTMQQSTEYSCGPVAANTVVKYYKGDILHSEFEVCKIMNTSTTQGTTTKGMVKYFEHIGWDVNSSVTGGTPKDYKEFIKWVDKNLKANTPIIVENVDFGGHWRVIIGHDTMGTKHTGDDVLFLVDPYDTSDHLQDGYNTISAERFYYMWFDHQLFKKGEQTNQWLTAKPKE